MKTRFKEYAHQNHAEWLEKQIQVAPSPLGSKIANILGYVGGGLYNCPINLKDIDWTRPYFIEVPWEGSLSNFDNFALSRLWVLCHRNSVRVNIRAVELNNDLSESDDDDYSISPRPTLILTFHQWEKRPGSILGQLPNCEEIIRDIDDDFELASYGLTSKRVLIIVVTVIITFYSALYLAGKLAGLI